jgi:lysine 2,3-aminomutase
VSGAARRTAERLAADGLVAPAAVPGIEAVARRYAVAITPALRGLIDAADPADPIARQVVPSAAELETQPGELADPIGDRAHSPVEGLVHRYPDRVLLMPVGVCPVYCRYCFRRARVGRGDKALSDETLAGAFDYIRDHPEIWEVILSGGDPLMLPPARLARIAEALAAIPHVDILRVHSRVPTADPARITDAMVSALTASRLTPWLAIHVNHPRELGSEALAAIARLADAGIPLLSQSVLLRGVNDDPAVLAALFRALVKARVKPYYLHQLDPAPGTGHFRVPLAEGKRLMEGLRGRLSGLCLPTYMLELPGGAGKVPAARAVEGCEDATRAAGVGD